MYVLVNFICMGLLELQGTQSKNYEIKSSCPHWDSNPVYSPYEADALPIAPRDLIPTFGLKIKFIIRAFYLYLALDVEVFVCVYYILLTLYSPQLNVYFGQTSKRNTCYMYITSLQD